jgi:two-component system chemotaxis sensor kinase CheA
MSFDLDEDILADFMIEAGEILEQLQEQLVELENNPEDTDLLNAIFRGYHTVKGGAGFLSLTELVDICHGAENVFDVMRNGQRTLTPELMDVILQATDVVVSMFEQVKEREPLTPAPAELIDVLHKLSEPEVAGEQIFGAQAAAEPVAPAAPTPAPEPVSAPAASPEANNNIDDITDDEFEALLDSLHGKGQFAADSAADKTPETPDKTTTKANSASDDEITDDEFEALLDQLHGMGKGPQAAANTADKKATPAPATPAATPKSGTQANSSPGVKSGAAPASQVSPATSKPVAKETKKSATPAAAQETTVRVDTKRLDQIMNMVGELVLVRNRLISLSVTSNDENLGKAIANLDVVTGDLQGAVMKTRMQPIKKVFGRFPRVVRDLARSLKKEITLELIGEETDLDKNLVEALADPLVHLVRNSVDHGVEMPDEREAAGKPRTGVVKLSAAQEGDHILLTIEDDGKGMDAEKLKKIAIERGVLDQDTANRMSDVEAFNLIFAPGFSTKTEITDVSGRGVGMDVVKTKISQLNGSVNIHSELGVGTRLEIKVPLTLAILPTLMIEVGQRIFALPLGSVNEIINMDIKKTNTVDGQLTKIVRERAIPLFYLNDWLNPRGPEFDRKAGHVVVVQISTQQVGFVVDALIGQEEVVIKPLDAVLQGTAGMAGATITSDGRIALILDIPGLLKRYANSNLK